MGSISAWREFLARCFCLFGRHDWYEFPAGDRPEICFWCDKERPRSEDLEG